MTTERPETVAEAVASALERARLTRTSLAAASGMSLADLEDKLAGRSPFTVTDLGDIAFALGVRAADLAP